MSLISWCWVALALEYMSQVAATVGADNFSSGHSQAAVRMASDGAGDAVKISRPPTARLELMVGLVQGRTAAGAGVDPGIREELVVLAGEGCLCALLPQNPELFCDDVNMLFRRSVPSETANLCSGRPATRRWTSDQDRTFCWTRAQKSQRDFREMEQLASTSKLDSDEVLDEPPRPGCG